jgi:uncharacterized protein (DUF58 family)
MMIADYDLDLLTRLYFVANKRRHPGLWGERRSTHQGDGIEFTDYRDYSPGDDPRSVDWNLYARLDRPYVRLYEEEEDMVISVLVDGSHSMGWKANTINRWTIVQQIATALGGIALMHGDTLFGGLAQTGSEFETWGPYRGRGFYMLWQTWVGGLNPFGSESLAMLMEDYALRAQRPALVLVLTDGYDIGSLQRGISMLASHRHEVVILHILTPDELEPTINGDLRLIDSETDNNREVTIDMVTLASYKHKLEQWCSNIRQITAKHNGRYVLLRADLPLRRLLLEDLRYADVLR